VWNGTVAPFNTYLLKLLVDGAFAFLLLQFPCKFSRAQSFLIWLSAGLNLAAFVEFYTPLMIVYNSYAIVANGINVLQIFVVLPWVEKLVYGAFTWFDPVRRFCVGMDMRLGFVEKYGR
jgi:hypothetical protein